MKNVGLPVIVMGEEHVAGAITWDELKLTQVIMHTRKHVNILKHFIHNIIYKNNMYQCVPQDGAFIFLLGRRLK